MNNKPFSKKEFKNIYSRVPRLCVELAIQTPKGIVLALRSLPSWNNLWHMPGGTVLYKEKISNAAKRIAKDELGIKIEIKKLLSYIEYPKEEKERGFGYSVSLVFLCHTKSKTMRPDGDSSEIKIFNKIPKNIVAEHRKFLKSEKLLK